MEDTSSRPTTSAASSVVRLAVVVLACGAAVGPCGAYSYQNDELSTIAELHDGLRGRERVVAPEQLDAELRSRIYEPAVLEVLDKCPCQDAFGSPDGTPRLYIFDTSGEISSGLNHQLSNLKAILTEGLSLGRAVLLRRPTLTREHNFDRPFKYNMWGDFIAFNKSSFVLTPVGRGLDGTNEVSGLAPTSRGCQGVLSDCVADISEPQLLELAALPLTMATYHNGTVARDANARPGLLVRGPRGSVNAAPPPPETTTTTTTLLTEPPADGAVTATTAFDLAVAASNTPDESAPAPPAEQAHPAPIKRESTALVRKLPGFAQTMQAYQLRLNLRPPDHVARAVPPVMQWLKEESTTGRLAVVHVRRGDKITNKKYCPREMQLATSPTHIAKVLAQAGVPGGSAVYIMSDETDLNHFRPLTETHGYAIATNVHFDHLHALLEGCSAVGAQRGLPCENYLLFAIEKEILNAVPSLQRVVTLPRHDLAHNPHYLMQDFLGPNKPCKSL